MRKPALVMLTFALCVLLVGFITLPLAAEETAEEESSAVTTEDSQVPVEELGLVLKAFTKDELLVEVEGWQGLLREKALEIGEAQAAVKRQNREIEEAEDAPGQAQETGGSGEEVEEKAAESGEGEKVELLEKVNALREERTQLIDRLKAVLDELESKTDKEDGDTLAKIKDFRLYIDAVQGIELDLEDTTSAWIAIKGWLVSEEGGLRVAKNIVLFVGILFAAWMLSRLLSRAVRRALVMSGTATQLLEDFLVGAVRWVVMAIGIIMALAALEVSVGPLLAVVGAAGFVIAFALQDSLSNFASGIMILFFRPYDVGDVVDAGGVSGKVISMNLVATTIKTFDNKDMVVPNNKIWHDVITNATAVATRRVDMEFGIGYEDDIDQAQAILEEIVGTHPKALKDPAPTIRMNTLADSSINFICRPWSKTEDYWDVYWDVTREVKLRFDAAGIGIPFPQRDVHLYVEGGMAKEQITAVASDTAAPTGGNPQPYELDEGKQGSDVEN